MEVENCAWIQHNIKDTKRQGFLKFSTLHGFARVTTSGNFFTLEWNGVSASLTYSSLQNAYFIIRSLFLGYFLGYLFLFRH